MADFTHFTHDGRPQMVNVGEKDETSRTAIATGQVFVQKSTLLAVREGGLKRVMCYRWRSWPALWGQKKPASLSPYATR